MSLNPEDFLNQTTDEANDTVIPVCDEGEYSALVEEIIFKEVNIKKGERAGQTAYMLEVFWAIQDEGQTAQLGFVPKVKQGLWLDMTEDGNGIDRGKGKNVRLGRLREAVGQNVAGQPWSPNMLKGQVAVVKVEHSMEGENIYANINRVAGM